MSGTTRTSSWTVFFLFYVHPDSELRSMLAQVLWYDGHVILQFLAFDAMTRQG